jgi:hypothetical protein
MSIMEAPSAIMRAARAMASVAA